jgi:hypothetical protein
LQLVLALEYLYLGGILGSAKAKKQAKNAEKQRRVAEAKIN